MDFVQPNARSPECLIRSTLRTAKYAVFAGSMLFLVLAPRIAHLALARLRQPRLVSQMIVGIIFGNSNLIKGFMDERVPATLNVFMGFTFMAYTFVVGLEMDTRTMFRWGRREVVVSYAGMTATVAMFLFFYPLFDRGKFTIAELHNWSIALVLGVIFASTSSPVLTRLTTDLKIGKSDIGKLAVKAGLHNDMVTTLFLCCTNAAMRNSWMSKNGNIGDAQGLIDRGHFQLFFVFLGLAVEAMIVFKVVPRYMSWVEERNPAGKRIKESDLAITFLFIGVMCTIGSMFIFSYRTTAFLVGLVMPRDGRIATTSTKQGIADGFSRKHRRLLTKSTVYPVDPRSLCKSV